MVIAIAPSSLTPSGLASQKAKLAQVRAGLSRTAANRRHVQTLLADATRKHYNPALIARLQAQLKTTTGQTAAQQKAYDSYYATKYKPYETSYTQLTNLGNQNASLDSVLNKLLPFDPQGAADRLGAQQTLNQALLSNKQGRDELAGDYATGQQQLNTEQPDRYRALLSNFAGRGMANSSGYATSFGNESADFARRQTDLNTQNQRGQAQYGMADAGAQSDFLSSIAGVLSGTTGRLASDAGTLGMAGNTNLPLLLELARRRLAAQGS